MGTVSLSIGCVGSVIGVAQLITISFSPHLFSSPLVQNSVWIPQIRPYGPRLLHPPLPRTTTPFPGSMVSKVIRGLEDPLSHLTAPPPNETPDARWAREQHEAQARRISEQIDEELRTERQAQKRQKKPIKVLLLGQSESGKSTTVKSEPLLSRPSRWHNRGFEAYDKVVAATGVQQLSRARPLDRMLVRSGIG